MISDNIISLAKKVNKNTKTADIVLLQGGFSSQAYKISPEDSKPFVLLTEREGAVSNSDYGRAYVALTLLKRHDFKHVPQALWLSDDQSALAISYYDGKASHEFDFNNLDKEQIAINVIDSLLDTAVITEEEYDEVAKQFSVTKRVQTLKDSARMYGSEWLESVKQSCPDKDIVDWLVPRVERAVEQITQTEDQKPSFGHGDPSNPNILLKPSGDFMLIDWGSARFYTGGPEFLVSYTTHLTDFMAPYRENIIQHIANRLNIPLEEFSFRVKNIRMASEVFDVNWAAMMMAKVNAGEAKGDIDKFRSIARERIKSYEKDFS